MDDIIKSLKCELNNAIDRLEIKEYQFNLKIEGNIDNVYAYDKETRDMIKKEILQLEDVIRSLDDMIERLEVKLK